MLTTFFTRSAAQLHSNVCVYDGLGLGGFVNDFKNVKADQSERPPLTNLSKETERSEDTNCPRWHKHSVVGRFVNYLLVLRLILSEAILS